MRVDEAPTSPARDICTNRAVRSQIVLDQKARFCVYYGEIGLGEIQMATVLKFPSVAVMRELGDADAASKVRLLGDLVTILENLLSLQADALIALSELIAAVSTVPDVAIVEPKLTRVCEACRTVSRKLRDAQAAARGLRMSVLS